MSTLLIVLIVLGVLALLCCGGCAGCFYFGASTVTKQFQDPVMAKIRANQAVKDKLGEPLSASFPTNTNAQNQNVTVDFTISGPKGTANVHAELIGGPNGFEPTKITVTPTDGQVIEVPTGNDPTQIDFPDFGEGIKIDPNSP